MKVQNGSIEKEGWRGKRKAACARRIEWLRSPHPPLLFVKVIGRELGDLKGDYGESATVLEASRMGPFGG